MPQETIHKTPLEFAEAPTPQAPISVETYADELMDDIFQDVEQVLKGGSRLPSEPVKPEFVSLKSIKVPQIILPPMPRADAEEEQASQLRDARAEQQAVSLDRILLGVAFSSLFITLLLWLATKGGLGRLFAPEPRAVSPEPVLDAKTKADIQFADYVERSLKNIEQPNLGNNVGLPLLPPPPPSGTLPVLPVPGTPPVAASPDLNTNNLVLAINRVAEAIQDASNQTATLSAQVMNTLQAQNQQPQPTTPQKAVPGGRASGNVIAPTPTTAPTSSSQPQAESKPAATAPAPSTNQTAEAPAPQAREIVPEAEEAPPPPAAAAPVEAPPAEQALLNPAPVTAHTLVGILELGDRSAALFEINGVARRIYVGESVGASGWTLVEVVNQEAVIRRNGEVRTIFVGQQF